MRSEVGNTGYLFCVLFQPKMYNFENSGPLDEDADSDLHYDFIDIIDDEDNGQSCNVNDPNSIHGLVEAELSTIIIRKAVALSNTLNEFTRDELIENITDSYLHNEILLPTPKIGAIAREICYAFPNEDMAVFFTEPSEKTAARGRLYNRYRLKLKEMRKKNLFPKSSRAINKIRKLNEEKEKEVYLLSEDEKNSVEYLKRARNNLNFREIVDHWSITHTYRQKTLKRC